MALYLTTICIVLKGKLSLLINNKGSFGDNIVSDFSALSFIIRYVWNHQKVLSEKLFTCKEIFIYTYVRIYLHVEKYFFTCK